MDGGTGEFETNNSVLKRSIRCANSFKSHGIGVGDVIVIMAPHHLDLAIPIYASMFLGITVAAVDRFLRVQELSDVFNTTKPKAVFCESEKFAEVKTALDNTNITTKIITFDKCTGVVNFEEFCRSDVECDAVDVFKVTDFDPEETYCFLIATSGTTGMPKTAAVTHKNLMVQLPTWMSIFNDYPTPTKMSLVIPYIQWVAAISLYLRSPFLRFTRLQSSLTMTDEHTCFLINKYKPTYAVINPIFLNELIKAENKDKCDFTCFETLVVGGSAVSTELIQSAQILSPKTRLVVAYGLSEAGMIFINDHASLTRAMRPVGAIELRMVDFEGNTICKPNVPGELWVQGPSIFKGYYNNVEATKKAFSNDAWFKTGDMFYRDEYHQYYFVDRMKMLLKYKILQVSSVEIEEVISRHPDVMSVAVTGIPDEECGDLPAACVVRRSGATVTAQQIKDLVKDTLSDAKQLRGGVIFLDDLPLTSSLKINRIEVKKIAISSVRE